MRNCVHFFFGDRDIEFSICQTHTLKHLRGHVSVFEEHCLLNLRTESSFEQVFYDTDLDVDFAGSNVGGKCKTYLIEVTGQNFSKFNVDDCDSTSTLLNIDVTDCKCL